jgi:hypothetical protein
MEIKVGPAAAAAREGADDNPRSGGGGGWWARGEGVGMTRMVRIVVREIKEGSQ